MNVPTLTTRRLVLRPFTAADAPAVQALASAAEIAATTANIPHPYPEGAAAVWIAGHPAAHAAGSAAIFAITTPADGVVGATELRVTPAMLHAELGYWIGVPFWGRGFATEAAAALLDHAFGALGLKRVYAHHIASNGASGAVLKKIGMRWEGRLRAHLHRGRQFHDLELFGLVDDEHEQRQRRRAAATAFDHCTPVLPCADLEAALDFYVQRLGWERVFSFPELGYAGVARCGATLHLSVRAAPGRSEPVSCRFRVRGVDALHDEYQAAGVVDPKGPLERKPWGLREFVVRDRDGNALHLGEEPRA